MKYFEITLDNRKKLKALTNKDSLSVEVYNNDTSYFFVNLKEKKIKELIRKLESSLEYFKNADDIINLEKHFKIPMELKKPEEMKANEFYFRYKDVKEAFLMGQQLSPLDLFVVIKTSPYVFLRKCVSGDGTDITEDKSDEYTYLKVDFGIF